jgi:phosphate transport system permease protein
MRLKLLEQKIFRILMIGASCLVLGVLLMIVYALLRRGLPALSWEMITTVPGGGFYLGKEGGLLNAIVGSLMIMAGATILSLALSVPVVMFLNLYLDKTSRLAYLVRLSFDVLLGVPSIVYGAFGFMVMVFLGLRASLTGGMIVVSLLIFPIMARAMDEVAAMFPKEMKEATLSLGATKFEMVRVVLRQIAPGIATACLLSVGRAIGDAAAVLFTAGYTDSIPTSPGQPAATLPLAIFFQLSSPVPQVQDRAYAAALILTIIVLVLSVLSRWFAHKYQKNKVS